MIKIINYIHLITKDKKINLQIKQMPVDYNACKRRYCEPSAPGTQGFVKNKQ